MKKQAILIAMCFMVGLVFSVSNASADALLPGAYVQQDQSVMGVGKTIVEMGAHDRILTDAVNRASKAHMSRNSSTGINVDQQFGSSQSNQSWKAAKTVEEAEVVGLVAGDCRGDNSDDTYRRQMGQDRKGYMKEVLVPNDIGGDYHPTLTYLLPGLDVIHSVPQKIKLKADRMKVLSAFSFS